MLNINPFRLQAKQNMASGISFNGNENSNNTLEQRVKTLEDSFEKQKIESKQQFNSILLEIGKIKAKQEAQESFKDKDIDNLKKNIAKKFEQIKRY